MAQVIVNNGNSYTTYGAAGDTLLGTFGTNASITGQIVGTAGSETILLPSLGTYTVASGVNDVITASNSSANVAISGATGDQINLSSGTGNYTVIGANSTLFGAASTVAGSGDTITAGSSNITIIGGAFDSIVAGTGTEQIFAGQGSMAVAIGTAGNETISSGGSDTITAASGNANVAISAGAGDIINLSNNTGTDGVVAAARATISLGTGQAAVNGASGGAAITFGTSAQNAYTDQFSGSGTAGAGDTITGISGTGLFVNMNYNTGVTGASTGGADLINLSGWNGNATINAFSNGATQFTAVNDTILAGNGADSVWGGGGDRIGVGSVAGGSTVHPGGTHLWDHSTSVAGASIGFGSNDSVVATTYNTVNGTSSVASSVSGASAARVTVTNFQTASDYLFYQNESATTNNAIVLTATSSLVNGAPSTTITLPDGTAMTLVGISGLSPTLFK
ncbi:MAG: calcium-binding protein [Alphaproteobacteria bacterium]|nr:calcium-binding protein [Alphaproteobacteria bacterium]